MSIVQFDSQKIEQLLNSATNSRQRKMYQALLDKALRQEISSTNSSSPSSTESSTEKKAQPRHIPVVWDAPVEPFKFNPQLEKGEQMPRYFVEVRAIFKDGLYVVEEMLREPTRKLPKFIKVSKKEAAIH